MNLLMSHTAFVYGTLLSKPVLETLLGRMPLMRTPALLKGHKRFALADKVYPGMIVASESTVSGALLEELTDEELKILDWFEDEPEIYTRTSVKVEIQGEMVDTEAYIYNNVHNDIMREHEWDYERFVLHNQEWYVENTAIPYRKELDQMGKESK